MAQKTEKETMGKEVLIGIIGGLVMVVIVVTIGSVIGQVLSSHAPETEIQGKPVDQGALEAK